MRVIGVRRIVEVVLLVAIVVAYLLVVTRGQVVETHAEGASARPISTVPSDPPDSKTRR